MSYPKCPHCPRDFHGLAITERLEEMRAEYRSRVLYPDGIGEEDYATSAILGDYRHDTDTSRVLCPGSTFIGPRALTPAEAKRDQRWARIIQVEDDPTARLTPLNVDAIPDGEPMFVHVHHVELVPDPEPAYVDGGYIPFPQERELSFTLHNFRKPIFPFFIAKKSSVWKADLTISKAFSLSPSNIFTDRTTFLLCQR